MCENLEQRRDHTFLMRMLKQEHKKPNVEINTEQSNKVLIIESYKSSFGDPRSAAGYPRDLHGNYPSPQEIS